MTKGESLMIQHARYFAVLCIQNFKVTQIVFHQYSSKDSSKSSIHNLPILNHRNGQSSSYTPLINSHVYLVYYL